MKNLFFLLPVFVFALQLRAQEVNCVFKPPQININFGTNGNISDLSTEPLYNYRPVGGSCPTDGHFTFTSFTSDCFRGDWVTLEEDHTAGDVGGNMMLVNASPRSGTFLTTAITGLKPGTAYEFGVWMLNVCKPTEKCPFPLLPDISIRLQTADGKIVMQFSTGELTRHFTPEWTQYKTLFTATSSEPLTLTMIDSAPGGCGNDFALDDITFRECIITKPPVTTARKTPPAVKQKPVPIKTVVKKDVPPPIKAETKKEPAPTLKIAVKKEPPLPLKPVVKKAPVVPMKLVKKEVPVTDRKLLQISQPSKLISDSLFPVASVPLAKPKPLVFSAPPPVLRARENALVKKIETEAGEIRLDLYDNGDIDGDTITVYHNNVLVVSHARLSAKPISFSIAIDAVNTHHELVLVAENLGSIPPNTSLMVVKAGTKRYEVFISSTEQKNAKVIFDLKEDAAPK